MKLPARHTAARYGLVAGRSAGARRTAGGRLARRMVLGTVTAAALVVGASAAPALGVSAAPAVAGTWTVSPGGPFSGTDPTGTTVITDTAVPTSVTCKISKITGTLHSGSGLSGTHIGEISTATFTECFTGSKTFKVTASGFPWFLNAISYSSPVTSGHVTGIHLGLVGPAGCSAVVDGTAAAANDGKVTFHYSNTTHKLKFAAPAALKFYAVTAGCGPLFASTDPATYTAIYKVTPAQSITSP
jgi:hypothetical protein